jgi:hypothetical protein
MGCLGCGCLILAVLALLVLGLAGAGGYIVYADAVTLTSSTPLAVPSFDGGDEMYNAARQKVVAFDHDLDAHQAATLQLSGDEINTLIARDPRFAKNKILLYVSLANNEATLKTSVPIGVFSTWFLTDRYLNGTTSFGLDFDADAKTLDLDLHNLQMGEKELPQNVLPVIQTRINPALNQLLQNDPELKLLLDQAKSIEIKDNLLVIETQ